MQIQTDFFLGNFMLETLLLFLCMHLYLIQKGVQMYQMTAIRSTGQKYSLSSIDRTRNR